MHNLCLIILATNTILIDYVHIILTKLHVLKDFLRKGTKSAKKALLTHNYSD